MKFTLSEKKSQGTNNGGVESENQINNVEPKEQKKHSIKKQETQTVPKKKNPKRPTPRHIIIKMANLKYKQRTLKA